MLRSLRTSIAVALVAVLMGAPLAAVACAEWCTPSAHAGHLQPAAADSGMVDCHGMTPGTGPRVSAHVAPECLDATFAWREAGPAPSRLDLGQPHVAAVLGLIWAPQVDGEAARPGPSPAHASPPRPPSASPVLRI